MLMVALIAPTAGAASPASVFGMPAAMKANVNRTEMKTVIRMKYLLDLEAIVCVRFGPILSAH